MPPHFGLWRYFCKLELQRDGDGVPDYGGATIRPRPDLDYFSISMPKLTKVWQRAWFYAPNLPAGVDVASLPPFKN